LALASPSCNYCGRRLPQDYIDAREADLKRITEIRASSSEKPNELKVSDLILQTAREGREESLLDILNAGNVSDLLS
jgi:hypothetical protein